MRARWANERPGPLTDYVCPICNNWGFTTRINARGYMVSTLCQCEAKRRSMRLIRQSGMGDMVERYTLEAFQTPEPWQAAVKTAAEDFLEARDGWFAVLGSVGSGKTHICTAICGELLNAGIEVRYFRWADDSRRLKGLALDQEEYRRMIEPFKQCKALYVDDFLKTKRGMEPTAADINLAFELLDYRYCNSQLITILSSERMIDEILSIDEALGSRIFERTKGHRLELSGDKNWRTR